MFWNKTAPLNSVLAPAFFPTPEVLLTKDGNVGAFFKVDGVDFETMSDEDRLDTAHQIQVSLRSASEQCRIYQWLSKRRGSAAPYHRSSELFTIDSWIGLLYEPMPLTPKWPRDISIKQSVLDCRVRQLNRHVTSVIGPLTEPLGITRLNIEGIFSLLRVLVGDESCTHHPRYSDQVDYWAGQHSVLRFGESLLVNRPIEVLCLTDPPRVTFPGIYNELLRLDGEFLICLEFRPLAAEKTVKQIRKAEKHFNGAKVIRDFASALVVAFSSEGTKAAGVTEDPSAAQTVKDLGKSLVSVNNAGQVFGDFSMTLQLRGNDRNHLQHLAAEAIQIVGNREGVLANQGANSLNAYLACIPGNGRYNMRQIPMSATNFADMSLVYLPGPGEQRNVHLRSEALCVLETTYRTAHHFNIHEGDLLGAMITGQMGSGKSLLTNLVVDSAARKYNPIVYVLDIGGSYQFMSESHGGSCLRLGTRKNDFRLNPFDVDKSNPDNRDFLSVFVTGLLQGAGIMPTPKQCRLIDRAILSAGRLGELDLPEELREGLYNWIGDGRFGWLFDNEQDTLSVSDFQVFDFQAVNPALLDPLFAYLFFRISQRVYEPQNTGRLKMLVGDEVWKLIQSPAVRNYFIEAGKTWRKHNGGIILTTQSALDLPDGMLERFNEICPTKILLSSPGSDRRFYARVFGLNHREVEIYASLQKKRQILVKTPSRSSLLNVFPTPEQLVHYSNDPNFNAIRSQYIAQYGREEGMRRLAAEAA